MTGYQKITADNDMSNKRILANQEERIAFLALLNEFLEATHADKLKKRCDQESAPQVDPLFYKTRLKALYVALFHRNRLKALYVAHYEDIYKLIQCSMPTEEVHAIFNFPLSSKWPEIFFRSFGLFGVFSGVSMTLLPEFMANGLLVMSLTGIVLANFIIPFLLVLPYVLYKAHEDMSKYERLQRCQEALLKAKKRVTDDMVAHKELQPIPTPLESTNPNDSRQLLNSTIVNVTYVFDVIFTFCFAVLTTFSLSTPLGWCIAGSVAVTVGLTYFIYHNWHRTAQIKREEDLLHLQTELSAYDKQISQLMGGEPKKSSHENTTTLDNAQIRELNTENAALTKQLTQANARISTLTAENANLTAQLAQTTTNAPPATPTTHQNLAPLQEVTSTAPKKKRPFPSLRFFRSAAHAKNAENCYARTCASTN